MKQELIQIIEEKEGYTAPYVARINEELPHLMAHEEMLFTLKRMKKEGHIIYPELHTGCSSLILHLLGLNPLNPLDFSVPFLVTADEDLCFYANHSALKAKPGLPLTSLQLLSELQIVCHYLQTNLDAIAAKLVHETHIHFFVADLLKTPYLRARSFFLVDTVVDYFDQLENCRATSFNELVEFVYGIFLKQHAYAESPSKIAEVYMDVLMTGWIWWLGGLAKK